MPHPSLVVEIAGTHAAAARWGKARGSLESYAVEPVAEGAIAPSPVEVNIAKPDAVRNSLRRVFSRVSARGPDVALLIPDPVVRVFILPFETFPRRSDEALPLLRWRLKKSVPFDVDEVCNGLQRRHSGGQFSSIVVISEGCELPGVQDSGEVDQFGHVILGNRGVGEVLGREIEQRTGFETRVTVLGHVQRGGSPTPRDRVLATRFGLKAAELSRAGEFGTMAALRGDDIVAVPLAEATAELKTVPPEWYAVAQAFFG